MIQSGEIEIGQAVVPIEISKKIWDPETNAIVTKTNTVCGRKIALSTIRRAHLELLRSKGILRQTPVEGKTRSELIAILQRNQGEALYSIA